MERRPPRREDQAEGRAAVSTPWVRGSHGSWGRRRGWEVGAAGPGEQPGAPGESRAAGRTLPGSPGAAAAAGAARPGSSCGPE